MFVYNTSGSDRTDYVKFLVILKHLATLTACSADNEIYHWNEAYNFVKSDTLDENCLRVRLRVRLLRQFETIY